MKSTKTILKTDSPDYYSLDISIYFPKVYSISLDGLMKGEWIVDTVVENIKEVIMLNSISLGITNGIRRELELFRIKKRKGIGHYFERVRIYGLKVGDSFVSFKRPYWDKRRYLRNNGILIPMSIFTQYYITNGRYIKVKTE